MYRERLGGMSEFTHLIDLASARLGGQADRGERRVLRREGEPPQARAGGVHSGQVHRSRQVDGRLGNAPPPHARPRLVHRQARPAGRSSIRSSSTPRSSAATIRRIAGSTAAACRRRGSGRRPTSSGIRCSNAASWPATRRTRSRFPRATTASAASRTCASTSFPDGGVARLRVMGEVLPDWTRILATGRGDRSRRRRARRLCRRHERSLLRRAAQHADAVCGGEHGRRLGDQAAARARVTTGRSSMSASRASITRHRSRHRAFQRQLSRQRERRGRGDARRARRRVGGRHDRAIGDWKTVLPQTKLQPDHLHRFEAELAPGVRASHVRLNIYPDGGVSRFRVFGIPDAEARRRAVLRQLNAMDDQEIRAVARGLLRRASRGSSGWRPRVRSPRRPPC